MTTTAVKPSDIDATRHLWDAFGHSETEVSAGYIVRFCQERGDWVPFTYKEINDFYLAALGADADRGDKFTFNGLMEVQRERLFGGGTHTFGGSWVIKDPKGFYHVSEDFVARCHRSSPRGGKKAKAVGA